MTKTPCRSIRAKEVKAWDKVGGETDQGLVNRRTAERALFLTPDS